MEAHIKQRIVGAAVILVVFVLFLPVLIYNSKSKVAKASINTTSSVITSATTDSRTVVLKLPANIAQVSKSSSRPTFTKIQSSVALTKQTAVAVVATPKSSGNVLVLKTKQAGLSPQPTQTHGRSALTKAKKTQSVKVSQFRVSNKTKAKKREFKSARVAQRKQVIVRQRKKIKLAVKKTLPKKSVLVGNMILSNEMVHTKAWVLQLASFSSVNNAERLVAKLRQAGYDAYNKKSSLANGRVISRVFVGPEINRKKILRLQTKLKSRYKLMGLVRKFKIK
jgi:cell division septation protein DedD